MIIETEAYSGIDDLACHACRFGKTPRTEVMFKEGGVAYIYLCYGIHHLFNIVTNQAGEGNAVLIRALEPLDGINTMIERRQKTTMHRIASGPGTLTQALHLKTSDTGNSLFGPNIWLEDRGFNLPAKNIEAKKRIGVDYAGADAEKPWRFYIRDHAMISKK